MNKKILIVSGIIVTVAMAGYFGSGNLFQGRLSYQRQTQISSAMNGICIKPDAWEEKLKKYQESTTGESENSSSESSPSDDEKNKESSRNIYVKTPDTGTGRGMLENTNDEADEYQYEDEDEDTTEDDEDYYDELSDGSEKHPYYSFVECGCEKGGKIIEKTTDENGFYNMKICNLPDLIKCAPPEFQCPDGDTIDNFELEKICKKQKVIQCFFANPKFNQESSDMCSKLYYGYDKLKCVNQSQCEKYIKMSSTELSKYINSLIGNNPPEGMFNGGGGFGVNKKYKPKNDQEKKMFQETKLIVDCAQLYDVKL